jgi:hypothetical protein
MSKRNMQLAHLEALAGRDLSNYSGDIQSYAGEAGEWDDFSGGPSLALVDFDGNTPEETSKIFVQEAALGIGRKRIFQLKVVNAGAADRDFYINEGLDIAAVGTILADNGALVPIGGVGTINVSGVLKNWKFFRNYFRQNPTRVLGFKVASSDTLQMETNVSIEIDSPFHAQMKSRQIVLSDYQNEHTFRDKLVTVPEQFQLDEKTRVRMTVVAGSTMTITFYCGAVFNPSKALQKAAATFGTPSAYAAGILNSKAKLQSAQMALPG